MQSKARFSFSFDAIPKSIKMKVYAQLERELPYALLVNTATLSQKSPLTFQDADDFLIDREKEAEKHGHLFDPRTLYSDLNQSLVLIFEEDLSSARSIPLKDFRSHDQFGDRLADILRLNTPWTYSDVALQAFAMTCLYLHVGYFGQMGDTVFHHFLQTLPPEELQHCLCLGLMKSIHRENLEHCKFFLEWKADPNNQIADDGTTPLEYAMDLKNFELAKMLLSYGADPNMRLVSGLTGKDYAKRLGLPSFSELFDRHI
jgi:hypothetical protein